jgi:hypothetical protein
MPSRRTSKARQRIEDALGAGWVRAGNAALHAAPAYVPGSSLAMTVCPTAEALTTRGPF